jgi:hypothetical protein
MNLHDLAVWAQMMIVKQNSINCATLQRALPLAWPLQLSLQRWW